jgi:hypothetical protein
MQIFALDQQRKLYLSPTHAVKISACSAEHSALSVGPYQFGVGNGGHDLAAL